jgi:hypothetical protein
MNALNLFAGHLVATAALLLPGPNAGSWGALPPERVAAWEEYVTLTEARIALELASGAGFLAGDFADPETRKRDLDALEAGDIVIRSMESVRPDGSGIEVPGGMIHHWRGAIFIPGVTLAEVIDDVSNPDSTEYRNEDVLEARVLERGVDFLRVYLKLVRSKIVTATYNTEHLVEYRRHGEGRVSSRTVATHVRELAEAGTPNEREKAPSDDRGFLWRLNSYWRYQEVEGGVRVECESLTLSRSIPFFAALFVRPIVTSVAKESLGRTLTSMRGRIGGRTAARSLPSPRASL